MEHQCRNCGKILGPFDIYTLSTSHPGMPGFNMPSGGVHKYCKKCYEGMTTSVPEDTPEKKGTLYIGKILRQVESKRIRPDLLMNIYHFQHEDGVISLVLWNQEVEVGKRYEVDGYVRKFDGRDKLTLGYKGSIKEVE